MSPSQDQLCLATSSDEDQRQFQSRLCHCTAVASALVHIVKGSSACRFGQSEKEKSIYFLNPCGAGDRNWICAGLCQKMVKFWFSLNSSNSHYMVSTHKLLFLNSLLSYLSSDAMISKKLAAHFSVQLTVQSWALKELTLWVMMFFKDQPPVHQTSDDRLLSWPAPWKHLAHGHETHLGTKLLMTYRLVLFSLLVRGYSSDTARISG